MAVVLDVLECFIVTDRQLSVQVQCNGSRIFKSQTYKPASQIDLGETFTLQGPSDSSILMEVVSAKRHSHGSSRVDYSLQLPLKQLLPKSPSTEPSEVQNLALEIGSVRELTPSSDTLETEPSSKPVLSISVASCSEKNDPIAPSTVV